MLASKRLVLAVVALKSVETLFLLLNLLVLVSSALWDTALLEV